MQLYIISIHTALTQQETQAFNYNIKQKQPKSKQKDKQVQSKPNHVLIL